MGSGDAEKTSEKFRLKNECSFPILSTFFPATSNSLLTAGRWGCSCLPADPFQGWF